MGHQVGRREARGVALFLDCGVARAVAAAERSLCRQHARRRRQVMGHQGRTRLAGAIVVQNVVNSIKALQKKCMHHSEIVRSLKESFAPGFLHECTSQRDSLLRLEHERQRVRY